MRILIPALHYADYLAATLPGWRVVCPDAQVVVLTASEDDKTQAVAARFGAEVFLTDVWQADGARFNKARSLDAAMGMPTVGDLFASVDADVYPCGEFPAEAAIAPGTIYGCARYLCASPRELEAHLQGQTLRDRLPLLGPKVNGNDYNRLKNTPRMVLDSAQECLGFFQLFRWAGQRFGSYPTAGKCDSNFRQQFETRCGLTDFYMLHLGMPNRQNWAGRVAPAWGPA